MRGEESLGMTPLELRPLSTPIVSRQTHAKDTEIVTGYESDSIRRKRTLYLSITRSKRTLYLSITRSKCQ